jgi:flavin reductase (DIM6/NTAB) family NADH-FMN oxidoreductase RutF
MEHTKYDPRELRNALGHFATGITVVTTVHEDVTYGMTANAFLSVSLDPPLVLVAADNRTQWHQKVSHSGRYGVSVLSEEQGRLSDHFAGRNDHEELEIRYVWQRGVPLLEGALAHFVCQIVDAHPAGDHTLHIAEIEYLDYQEGAPLLFYTGTYEGLEVWETSFFW